MEYSNSPVDETERDHEFNADHYCTNCFTIDESFMGKDAETGAYQIDTPEKWNTFAKAVNGASVAVPQMPMQFASGALTGDIAFAADATFTVLNNLRGYLHGNGHSIDMSACSSQVLMTSVLSEGRVMNLHVTFPVSTTKQYLLCTTNYGQINSCQVDNALPTLLSYGNVLDCRGDKSTALSMGGRYTRCLVRNNTASPLVFDYYNGYNDLWTAPTAQYSAEQGYSGELTYLLSHDSADLECVWGQNLGVDAAPRICYGQTPASDTFVTRLTSYAAEYPEGKIEYMNAGMGIEAAPGYYKVSADVESWPTHPEYNFIIDNGDGTYTAEAIKLDPDAAHHLPFEVEAETFLYEESLEEGDVASLMFPVDIPVSKINGTVYLLGGYNATDGQLEFVTSTELTVIPANVPFLVKVAKTGKILDGGSYSETNGLLVSPMTGANSFSQGDILHIASYHNESLPASEADTTYYYTLSGTAREDTPADTPADAPARVAAAEPSLAAVPVPAGGATLRPFAAYFALPASLAGDTSIPVVLKTEIITSIDDLPADSDENAPCYNLRGIRVSADAKGLIIVNGKKVYKK